MFVSHNETGSMMHYPVASSNEVAMAYPVCTGPDAALDSVCCRRYFICDKKLAQLGWVEKVCRILYCLHGPGL